MKISAYVQHVIFESAGRRKMYVTPATDACMIRPKQVCGLFIFDLSNKRWGLVSSLVCPGVHAFSTRWPGPLYRKTTIVLVLQHPFERTNTHQVLPITENVYQLPVMCLARLGCARLGWSGLGWVGLGWVGLGWVGLSWVGLSWVELGVVVAWYCSESLWQDKGSRMRIRYKKFHIP